MRRWMIGLAALSALGGAGAAAQDAAGGTEPFRERAGWRGDHRRVLSAEDRAAFADARIAALRAGLRLSPEQEKLWPPVEEAIRGLARQRNEARTARRERFAAWEEGRRPDVPDMLRALADRQSASADAVRKLADGMAPLYASLDDGQKRRLAVLGRGLIRAAGPRGRPGRH